MTSERLGTVTTEDGDQCTQGNIGRGPRGKTIKKRGLLGHMFIIQKRIFSILYSIGFLVIYFHHIWSRGTEISQGQVEGNCGETFRRTPKMETYDGNYFRVCWGPGDCPQCSAVVVVVVAAITPPWHAGKDSALSNSAAKLLITFLWKLLELHPRPAPPRPASTVIGQTVTKQIT